MPFGNVTLATSGMRMGLSGGYLRSVTEGTRGDTAGAALARTGAAICWDMPETAAASAMTGTRHFERLTGRFLRARQAPKTLHCLRCTRWCGKALRNIDARRAGRHRR